MILTFLATTSCRPGSWTSCRTGRRRWQSCQHHNNHSLQNHHHDHPHHYTYHHHRHPHQHLDQGGRRGQQSCQPKSKSQQRGGAQGAIHKNNVFAHLDLDLNNIKFFL